MDRAWDDDVGINIPGVRGSPRRRGFWGSGSRRGRECGGAADVGGNAELAGRNGRGHGRRLGVSVFANWDVWMGVGVWIGGDIGCVEFGLGSRRWVSD